MTVQTINDASSIARLEFLVAAMETQAARYRAAAQAHRTAGCTADAYDNEQIASYHAWVAHRTRTQLVTLSELRVADVQPPAHVHTDRCQILDCPLKAAPGLAELMTADEPPSTLVQFTGWLVERIGRLVPWASIEDWQTAAFALLRRRPGGAS